jgi:hypothetical protein
MPGLRTGIGLLRYVIAESEVPYRWDLRSRRL